MLFSRLWARGCEIIPVYGEPSCPLPAEGDEPALCKKHRKEYGRSYWTYKASSKEVIRLAGWLRKALPELRSEEDLSWGIREVKAYISAVRSEIRERRQHERRFFQEADEGHVQWMRHLETQQLLGEGFLADLRSAKAGFSVLTPVVRSAFWRALSGSQQVLLLQMQELPARSLEDRITDLIAEAFTLVTLLALVLPAFKEPATTCSVSSPWRCQTTKCVSDTAVLSHGERSAQHSEMGIELGCVPIALDRQDEYSRNNEALACCGRNAVQGGIDGHGEGGQAETR